MQEKRKFRRLNLGCQPKIYDARSQEYLGTVVNISTGGFKVLTRNILEQGKEYLLNIILPGEGKEKKVAVKARVCWCSKDIKSGSFVSGCCLDHIQALGRLDLVFFMLQGGAKPKVDAILESS